MPWYNELRPSSDPKRESYSLLFKNIFPERDKKRTIKNLLSLRKGLEKEIPDKVSDKNLLICTWNIKEFGHTDQRLPEAYFYITEILNRFDLIAVQEVKKTLDDLKIIMRLLGSDWDYIVNDITEGNKGNSERSAYIFNTNRVKTEGIAGEITLWNDLTKNSTVKQLRRSPYMTGFSAGWKKFSLINVHLTPGKTPKAVAERTEEIRLLAAAINHKRKRNNLWNKNTILLGDMNLYKSKDQQGISYLNQSDFIEANSLQGVKTAVSSAEAYDRIFFDIDRYFQIATNDQDVHQAGVFNFFDYVYPLSDVEKYKKSMKEAYGGKKLNLDLKADRVKYYKNPWRKNQMSDHYPVWVEIVTDSTDGFLQSKLRGFS